MKGLYDIKKKGIVDDWDSNSCSISMKGFTKNTIDGSIPDDKSQNQSALMKLATFKNNMSVKSDGKNE